MARLRLCSLTLGVCLVSGCAETPPPAAPESGQTYAQAIELMCNVDAHAGLSDADPLELSQKRDEWIAENIKHPDAIELRTLLTVRSFPERAKVLRTEAKEQHLKICPLADAYDAEPTN